MARGRKKTAARAACWLFVAVFAFSVVTNGVCICTVGGSPSDDGGRYIVSLDICGTGAASVAVQGMDVLALADAYAGLFIPSISLIPPTPEQAVASAEPGDMDKPPEA